MRKKWITIGVLLLLCVALGFSIWYHQPIHKTANMTVCTTDGKTARLEMDILIYRRFFKDYSVRGSVTLDGVRYLDEKTSFPPGEDQTHNWTFCKEVRKGASAEEKLIDLNTTLSFRFIGGADNYNLDTFMVSYLGGEVGYHEGVLYYSPAASAEEAKAIEQRFIAAWS